jgi:transcriptional regulator
MWEDHVFNWFYLTARWSTHFHSNWHFVCTTAVVILFKKIKQVKTLYIPAQFKIEDHAQIVAFMKAHSFATIISSHEGLPFASHLPLLVDEEAHCLYGHFARPNPQWTDVEQQEVLVIFQGPHCYISPSWYGIPTAVPTWNYSAVHVYGKIELLHDDDDVLRILHQLTSKYESPESTYDLNNVDLAYIAGMSKGIQSFKLQMTRIEGKAKLSQNQPIERQERIIRALEQKEHAEQQVAAMMRENLGRS